MNNTQCRPTYLMIFGNSSVKVLMSQAVGFSTHFGKVSLHLLTASGFSSSQQNLSFRICNLINKK